MELLQVSTNSHRYDDGATSLSLTPVPRYPQKDRIDEVNRLRTEVADCGQLLARSLADTAALKSELEVACRQASGALMAKEAARRQATDALAAAAHTQQLRALLEESKGTIANMQAHHKEQLDAAANMIVVVEERALASSSAAIAEMQQRCEQEVSDAKSTAAADAATQAIIFKRSLEEVESALKRTREQLDALRATAEADRVAAVADAARASKLMEDVVADHARIALDDAAVRDELEAAYRQASEALLAETAQTQQLREMLEDSRETIANMQADHQSQLDALRTTAEADRAAAAADAAHASKLMTDAIADHSTALAAHAATHAALEKRLLNAALSAPVAEACRRFHSEYTYRSESIRLTEAIALSLSDRRFGDAKAFRGEIDELQSRREGEKTPPSSAVFQDQASHVSQQLGSRIEILAALGEVDLAEVCFQERDAVETLLAALDK